MPKDRGRPKLRPTVIDHHVDDFGGADRMTSQLAALVAAIPPTDRRVLTVNLVVGENRVNHGLGARARGVTVCPTVADATFAWSCAVNDDRQVVITVVGVAQPGATIEVYR